MEINPTQLISVLDQVQGIIDRLLAKYPPEDVSELTTQRAVIGNFIGRLGYATLREDMTTSQMVDALLQRSAAIDGEADPEAYVAFTGQIFRLATIPQLRERIERERVDVRDKLRMLKQRLQDAIHSIDREL
jgi:hypothetical protein